jgi:putative transposase
MSSYLSSGSCLSFVQALAPFHQDEGLPFAAVLPVAVVEQAFAEEGVDFGATAHAVFTPAVTLWAFLSQVLEKDKSCRAAVSRVLAWRLAEGLPPCSQDTAAYCRARPKLPATVLKRLALEVGRNLETQAPKDWLWQGRHVTLVDGTTLYLPDTEENQGAYPQLSNLEPGLGFPILRMVVLLSLATACLLGMALAPYEGKETGETALLRQLLDAVNPGDVLLADRYYCTYWLVAMAQARGIDVVFRMHHLRDYDFRRGQRLGPDDHVVTWHRPKRPDWMDPQTYATMPKTLTVRELRVPITTPGCRTPEIVVATTLTDAARYAQDEVADLYHERWHAEPDIAAIKQALGMEYLRCKTPFMVEKEIWTHFLGYNLVRKASCQAALLHEVHPRAVSFTASQQTINAARSQLTRASLTERVRQGELLLRELGKQRVGNRPDRCEPRVVKRPPKAYKRLRVPRAQAQARLRKHRAARGSG